MRPERIIGIENIILDMEADTKEDLLHQMADLLHRNGKVKDPVLFLQDVWERENLGFTGAGNQIAIPHGISEQVINMTVAIVRTKKTIKWDTWQEAVPSAAKQVRLIVLFAVPKPETGQEVIYIEALKMICGKLADKSIAAQMMRCRDAGQIMELLGSIRGINDNGGKNND